MDNVFKKLIFSSVKHLISPKYVHFNEHIEIHEYEKYDHHSHKYMNDWDECKKIYLQNKYRTKNGTLKGFDLEKEYLIDDAEDIGGINIFNGIEDYSNINFDYIDIDAELFFLGKVF